MCPGLKTLLAVTFANDFFFDPQVIVVQPSFCNWMRIGDIWCWSKGGKKYERIKTGYSKQSSSKICYREMDVTDEAKMPMVPILIRRDIEVNLCKAPIGKRHQLFSVSYSVVRHLFYYFIHCCKLRLSYAIELSNILI